MQGFGAKVDARLKALERRLQDLETFSKALIMEEGIDWKAVAARVEALESRCVDARRAEALFDEMCDTDTNIEALIQRVKALEEKRGPGRPPKAKNGE